MIIVRDAAFEIVREITDGDELSRIQSLFDARSKVQITEQILWTHKLDFVPGSRWLYSPDGYLRILSKANVPTFEVADKAAFNAMLGVEI